jgi:glycosyltransferase involved in cell wall biosynthesis
LAFLGRISPEKRPDRAIEIAKRAGVPLKIAAKVDDADLTYFKAEIEPLLDHPLIEFLGEIDERQKCEFLGKARALLFPIDWPEPFGLVMIEAMSAGTPVIAWREGSVAEVVTDRVSGVIVESIEAAVAAVKESATMSRAAVRAEFERRFTVERMARAYVDAYHLLLARTPVVLVTADAVASTGEEHGEAMARGPAGCGERRLCRPASDAKQCSGPGGSPAGLGSVRPAVCQ